MAEEERQSPNLSCVPSVRQLRAKRRMTEAHKKECLGHRPAAPAVPVPAPAPAPTDNSAASSASDERTGNLFIC